MRIKTITRPTMTFAAALLCSMALPANVLGQPPQVQVQTPQVQVHARSLDGRFVSSWTAI